MFSDSANRKFTDAKRDVGGACDCKATQPTYHVIRIDNKEK